MKSLIVFLTTIIANVSLACWFTQENFNRDYIAGVNNYFAHYEETENISNAIYHNGISTSLPLTVWVKIGSRENAQGQLMPIVKGVLQYKVLPNGNWVTVKTVYNKLPLDRALPAAIFGKNNIDPQVAPGTEILIRVYLTDGIFETGDLDADITTWVPDIATQSNGGEYEGGWTAPFVYRVIFNGVRSSL